jgi:hypothetical protein
MRYSPNRLLEQVLDVLEGHSIRATYSAVAEVVGGIARGVMNGRVRTPRHSWVVRKCDGLPTGYHPAEWASALFAYRRIITTGAELRALMAQS